MDSQKIRTGKVLAITPGHKQSAWLLYDVQHNAPIDFGIDDNDKVVAMLIETAPISDKTILAVGLYGGNPAFVDSYDKPVGKDVFDAHIWIGRFVQAWDSRRKKRKGDLPTFRYVNRKKYWGDKTDSEIQRLLIRAYSAEWRRASRLKPVKWQLSDKTLTFDGNLIYTFASSSSEKDFWAALAIARSETEQL